VSTRLTSRDLALIAVFAALIAVLGLPGSISLPISSVPITAQTLGVMLAGSILGGRRGALAVIVLLLLVAAGLPLLAPSKFRPQGGLGVFTSLTWGYLIGWVPGAWVIGRLVEMRPTRAVGPTLLTWIATANAIGGMAVVYLFGVLGFWVMSGKSFATALAPLVTFLPGDLLKVAVSTVVTAAVIRGYPGIVPGRRRTGVQL